MILKEKDSVQSEIQALEDALKQTLPHDRLKRLEKDLAQVRAGLKGEQEAAYHIDFHLRDSPHWAVIHDLRIEWNSRVAQIDHLLIDRLLEVYVIESKSFRSNIRYANGGWERINYNHWEGIASPVEQNERHISVLQDLIGGRQLAPTRFGIALRPTFFNVVVVQPSCSITNAPEDVRIYRMDNLITKIRATDPSPLGLLKVVGPDALETFARELVACHTPAPKRTPPVPLPESLLGPATAKGATGQICQSCAGPLTNAEAQYCRTHAAQFANQLLCRNCQAYAGNATGRTRGEQPTKPAAQDAEVVAKCVCCGTGVDRKVVAFCRFNSRRFGGRVLCRKCQGSAASP